MTISVFYILITLSFHACNYYRQISAIVEILHYIFVWQLVDSSSIQSTSYSVLNFYTITDIINFRISCIKQYLISFLQSQGLATQSFTSFFDEVQVAFNGLIHDSLSIFSAVSEVIKENSPDFSSIQTSEKNLYYTNILNFIIYYFRWFFMYFSFSYQLIYAMSAITALKLESFQTVVLTVER